jgi:hypothetical protein
MDNIKSSLIIKEKIQIVKENQFVVKGSTIKGHEKSHINQDAYFIEKFIFEGD